MRSIPKWKIESKRYYIILPKDVNHYKIIEQGRVLWKDFRGRKITSAMPFTLQFEIKGKMVIRNSRENYALPTLPKVAGTETDKD